MKGSSRCRVEDVTADSPRQSAENPAYTERVLSYLARQHMHTEILLVRALSNAFASVFRNMFLLFSFKLTDGSSNHPPSTFLKVPALFQFPMSAFQMVLGNKPSGGSG